MCLTVNGRIIRITVGYLRSMHERRCCYSRHGYLSQSNSSLLFLPLVENVPYEILSNFIAISGELRWVWMVRRLLNHLLLEGVLRHEQ